METLFCPCGQEIYVFYNALNGMRPEYIYDDPDTLIDHCPNCGQAIVYEQLRCPDGSLAMDRPIYRDFTTSDKS